MGQAPRPPQLGIVENCGNEADIVIYNTSTAGTPYAAGIANLGASTAIIRNCYNTGDISGNQRFAGGISSAGNGTFTNCYSTGTVTGDYKGVNSPAIGGLIGQPSNYFNTTNCFSTGAVSATKGAVGGFAGTKPTGTYTATNNYCLDTACAGDILGAAAVTAEELASEDFLTLINNGGNAFKAGTDHPVLAWENSDDGGGDPDPSNVRYERPGQTAASR